MFYGLKIMGDSLKMLKDLPAFIEFAKVMSEKPLLGLLAGTVLTGLIQGSAATIGVVQKLYESGAMTLNAAMPFVFGACIGTTVTGVFAAIGGSLATKRTAGLHTLFNVIAAVIGMLFLPFYIQFINWISDLLADPADDADRRGAHLVQDRRRHRLSAAAQRHVQFHQESHSRQRTGTD